MESQETPSIAIKQECHSNIMMDQETLTSLSHCGSGGLEQVEVEGNVSTSTRLKAPGLPPELMQTEILLIVEVEVPGRKGDI